MHIVLVGPPGAGKGTQAQFIASHLSIPKISTGDIFRVNVSQGTELGREAKAYMDRGDLVPDSITIAMVRDRLAEGDTRDGFLLDGFPRTLTQAKALDETLDDIGTKLDVVLELVVDDDEVVRRLSGRRTCRVCGRVWHLDFDPPNGEEGKGECRGWDGPAQFYVESANLLRMRVEQSAYQLGTTLRFEPLAPDGTSPKGGATNR